ncbi:MAG: SMC family ATPase [Acidimicrobiia bacterium]
MRPLRIELEGFSAYRERVEVDFAGVDFFSLAGPTGSGKSSLVDAMVFALFGRVPRLGGNAVAPAITAGTDRTRVRFDFEVDGVGYTAVRMAQRTPSGGASVKEARLQQSDTVLAEGADDVTAEVEDLLRLRFDDFTRTVVLPQGEFARFLTATKSERQGLLRNLLGLDVYTRMRELARTRAAVGTERAAGARRSLEALDLPDDSETERAIAHRDALASLADGLPDREKALTALDRSVETARKGIESIEEAMGRLDAIEPPDRLDDLESQIADARSRVSDAEEAQEVAVEGLESLRQAAAELPSADQVAAWRRDRARLSDIDSRLETLGLEAAQTTLEQATAELKVGEEELASAREDASRARRDHAAHLLAAELEPGRPCPVCAREVEVVPERPNVFEVAELETAEQQAESEVSRLRAVSEDARTAVAKLETTRAGLLEQSDELRVELAGAPGPEQMESIETELRRIGSELDRARETVKTAEAELKAAHHELESLADASRQVSKRLTAAQLTVADLDPPVSEADDVAVQWKELIVWRDRTRERLSAELAHARSEVAGSTAAAKKARRELADDLEKHDVAPTEPFAVQVATALQTARSTVDAYEKALEASVTLAQQAVEAESAAAVANALANHLKANGFEQWLMAGALSDLVAGANDLLDQLSGGGYSLHSDESGSFSIIDHRNADEMRSVSTLSGGETFLVSLALALSLAETLAAKGGSGLDAIILDEGFGTLDDESLDTVASVLEELTGSGLMVGVITHVKELAARAPVRYEVMREPQGAKVRLVS